MTNTKAYCTECICKVALAHSSPKDNGMLIGEDGLCFHCGKSGLVVYYMILESTE